MKIILPIPPSSTNHSYGTNNGKWYKSSKITEWATECSWMIKKEKKNFPKHSDLFKVSITFYYGNKRKNDIDGRIKHVLDVLQAAKVYPDDSLVSDLIVAKRYDKSNPRMEVEVL